MKYECCKNCIFHDEVIPEVCEGCDDGDQFEEIDEDGFEDDSATAEAANSPVFRVIPIMEAA
jgi:hypothetical protein